MASGTAESAEELFGSLEAQLKAGNFEQGRVTSEQILAVLPNDEDATHCRVYCLLQGGRWSQLHDVLRRLASQHPALYESLFFERAYSLYKLERLKESLAFVSEWRQDNARQEDDLDPKGRMRHLHAQLLYRLGRYKESAAMYEELARLEEEREGNSIENWVNFAASKAAAMIGSLDSGTSQMSHDELLELAREEESYDLMFNIALLAAAEGNIEEAIEVTEETEALCRRVLAGEDGDEESEEVESDIDMLHVVTLAAVLAWMSGKKEKALKKLSEVSEVLSGLDAKDAALEDLVSINLSLSSEHPLKISSTATWLKSLKSRLAPPQVDAVLAGRALQLAKNGQSEEATRVLSLASAGASHSPTVQAAAASLAFSRGCYARCEAQLRRMRQRLEGNKDGPFGDVWIATALAAAGASRSRRGGHLTRCLETLPASVLAKSPLLLDCLIAQKLQKNDFDGAMNGVKRIEAEAGDDVVLQKRLAFVKGAIQLRMKRYTEACQAFSGGSKAPPTDRRLLAGWALAASRGEQKADGVKRLEAAMLKLQIGRAIDAEELEASSPPIASAPRAAKPAAEAETTVATKKKKKRKPRYPKGFDPTKSHPPPDPERWLPKHERSTWKKKKGRRGMVAKGPQGALPAAADAAQRKGPSTASTRVATEGRTAKGKRR